MAVIQRLLRGFKRWRGQESNKQLVTTQVVPHFLHMSITTHVHALDKLENPTQLEFEDSGLILKGRPSSIRSIRKLDKIFGDLVRKTGPAPLPEQDVTLFRAHGEDLALKGDFQRVSAHFPDNPDVAAPALDYVVRYHDGRSRRVQNVASFKLGK